MTSARGEVTLTLGEDSYVLRPEFGIVGKIEDELNEDLFSIGQKCERVQIRAKELLKVVHTILKHNGHKVSTDDLAKHFSEVGAYVAVMAIIAYARNYAFGGKSEKNAEVPPETAASPSTDTPGSASS